MNPLGDARQKFRIHYILVGILFIVFDLEVILLFPYATVLYDISLLGFWYAILFLIILTVGFFYEFTKGAIGFDG